MLKVANLNGWIKDFQVNNKAADMTISQLLYVDYTLLFCDAEVDWWHFTLLWCWSWSTEICNIDSHLFGTVYRNLSQSGFQQFLAELNIKARVGEIREEGLTHGKRRTPPTESLSRGRLGDIMNPKIHSHVMNKRRLIEKECHYIWLKKEVLVMQN